MVREGRREQIWFQTPTEGRQRRRRYHVVRQTVPNGGSGDWEGLAADGRQLVGLLVRTCCAFMVPGIRCVPGRCLELYAYNRLT